MKHKILTLLFAIIASVGTMFAQSGTCGDNLTWNLTNGVLVISGTGEMTDFSSSSVPWYSYRSSIQYVVIGNGVTNIGNYAFYGCSALTSVTIPNSVTSIGSWAFNGCSALPSVTIPNSVTTIRSSAFQYCRGLTSVSIPNSVTSIESFAFRYCYNLTTINVDTNNPNYCSVDGVLFNKDKTTLVLYPGGKQGAYVIPNSVISVGFGAFYYCSGLTSITIPNSVTSIENHAFSCCSELTSVTIPNSVTSINGNALGECSKLTSINVDTNNPNYCSVDGVLFNKDKTTLVQYPGGKQGAYIIPNSVINIREYAFEYSIGLTSVTIPNSVINIGYYAFVNCRSLPVINNIRYADSYLVEVADNTLTSYTIQEGTKWIGDHAFGFCTSMTSVTMPNSVTSIGKYAFYKCTALTSIEIPNSVTSIGNNAFNYCSGLTSVTVPNSVTSIEFATFEECSALTSVTIPNSVTSIGSSAFYSCSALTSVTNYATTPQTINANVFGSVNISACTLNVPAQSVNVYKNATVWKNFGTIQAIGGDTPCLIASGTCGENLTWELSCDSVLTISGTGAMADYKYGNPAPWSSIKSSIKSVVISNGVTSIGNRAFPGCYYLTVVTIPNSITNIGNEAFFDCDGLTTIEIPNSVTSIGNDPFASCDRLTSINVANANATYCSKDGVLFNKAASTLILYPGGKQGEYSIPNSVTSIVQNAFHYCRSLTSIEIPNSVTSIDNHAFIVCDRLTSINVANANATYCSKDGVLFNKAASILIRYPEGKQGEYSIPNSVISIGNYAFCYSKGLASMIIPNSVTSIGSSAFYGSSSLTSVTIPNSVTSIGSSAFYSCSALTSVTNYATTPQTINANVFGSVNISACTLNVPTQSVNAYKNATVWKNFGTIQAIGGDTPCLIASGTCGENLTWELSCDSVLTISGTGAMADFESISDNPWYEHRNAIKSVIIGDGITSIGKGAFYNCIGLTSVAIGNRVMSIGMGAFQNCIGLTSVTIPNSVTNIEYGAFKGCSVLRSVTIGNSVTSIGDYAFEYCSSLTSVEIPNSVTSIGYGAFGNCSGLASVTIDKNLASIGNFAFYNCSSLISVTNYATTPQTITTNVFGSVNISSCTLYVPAGSLAAYRTADVWKEFSTILAIGGDTPCTPISGTCGANLTWKLSCDSVLTISGTGAMANISSASDIPWYAYRDAIKSIVIGNGVTSIAGNAFQKCTNLTSVTIPNSVTSIGQVAFYECTALTSVTIPNRVTSIGMGAFTYCSSLTSITIPNSVTSIGQAAFGYCTGLHSVTIGSGITSIEQGLFGNCTALTSVTIPNNVTSIGQVAFIGCTSLTSVTIPNSVTSIGIGAFSGCSSLVSVTLPNGITSIEQETFGNCSSLTSVVIPDGVTSIGDWAFQNCTALTSVTIPSSVTNISDEVFSGCTALSSVTNYATTPQTIDEYVFDNVNISACTLYVPAESLAAYRTATIWKDFGTIQTIGTTDAVTIILSDVANYIDFQALNISDPDMVYHTVTSTDPYELANGSKLVGRLKSDGIEANNTWNVSSGYNVTIPTPTWEGVDSLKVGTMFRAASGTSIELGAFTTSEEGKLVVFYQPNGDSERGVRVTVNGENVEGTNLTGNGAKINGIRPAYAGEINLPAGNYEAGDVVIKLVTSTSNIFGIRIEKLTTTAPCLIASGICGENLTWELSCDSVLTISGTGAMTDYSNSTQTPWAGTISLISRVVIDDGVNSIGDFSFAFCGNLKSVYIGKNVKSIGGHAFYSCYSLPKVSIPNSVMSIGLNSFASCDKLASVTIGDNLARIGNGAFSRCVKLANINIPNSVTEIAVSAFAGCESLPVVNSIRYADTYLVEAVDKTLTSYSIRSGARWIGDNAFLNCTNLNAMDIPIGVISIGTSAFSNCTGLTTVTIPNTVSSIGTFAFQACYGLKSITNHATKPQQLDVYVFSNANLSACTLYVPKESHAAYQAADVWKDFGQILPINAEDIDVTTTTVTASATTADIVWPKVTGAVTYTLEIKKNGELICTLTFDEEGHLISMSFAAPSRHNAPHQTQAAGFSFTITGLESGTTYSYTMIVKGSDGNVLKTESGTFTTIGTQGIEDIQSDQVQGIKLLRDGQIYILRGGRVYTMQGQKVK